MELTDSQKEAVAAWFAAGASLDEIQKRIKTEFGVHMTYLDVRLLVAELPQPTEEDEGAAEKEGAKTPGTPKTPRTEPPKMGRDLLMGLMVTKGARQSEKRRSRRFNKRTLQLPTTMPALRRRLCLRQPSPSTRS